MQFSFGNLVSVGPFPHQGKSRASSHVHLVSQRKPQTAPIHKIRVCFTLRCLKEYFSTVCEINV